MTSFDTDKKHLTFLLDQIEQKDLALPDFQRDFVWDSGATRELVTSVMQSFPAGTLLLMQGAAKHFKPRSFSEAPDLTGEPSFLALDGQQRLTSLSLAFNGRGDYRYFLHLQELIDGEDLDEAVEVYHHKRVRLWNDVQGQAKDLALPLSRLRDFANWRDEVIDAREELGIVEDKRELRKQLNDLEKQFVTPVIQYQFPVTTLSRDTDLEAVCTIFETLNRTGVKLSVFDLLTARGFAQGIELRDMLEKSRAAYPLLNQFDIDPYYILQVVAIWAKGGPQRGTVIKLDVATDIAPRWDDAARFLHEALAMLQSECGVLTKKLLPYATMLLTLAAAWKDVDDAKGPEVGGRREKLRRWFWCATFAQRYETQANTRTQNDVPALHSWLCGTGEAPEVTLAGEVRSFRHVASPQRALYYAALSLSLQDRPLDFHVGRPLTAQRIADEQIDDHHIFPRAYLGTSVPRQVVDSVLNHTLIDKVTNIRISAKAPSRYLAEMEDAHSPTLLTQILKSHGLPTDEDGPLWSDNFEAFLQWRDERLRAQILEVTGWRRMTTMKLE